MKILHFHIISVLVLVSSNAYGTLEGGGAATRVQTKLYYYGNLSRCEKAMKCVMCCVRFTDHKRSVEAAILVRALVLETIPLLKYSKLLWNICSRNSGELLDICYFLM